ncbi:MAG: hypothetical protein ABFD00_10600 [Chloroherpetonaceae bacterium]
MNPYEDVVKEYKRQSEGPKRFLKGALGVGATIAGASSFAPIISKVAPFLSQYIPENLAIKGLSKINPKIGQFIKNSLDNGFDFNEVKNFLSEQIEESQKANVPEEKNIIEKYSPELHEFILKQINSGLTPLQAGALASIGGNGVKNFKNVIAKLTKDYKSPWSAILETVYGQENKNTQSNNLSMQPNNPQSMQTQPQAQNPGPGQQALMEILNKINQRLGF